MYNVLLVQCREIWIKCCTIGRGVKILLNNGALDLPKPPIPSTT